MPTLAVPSSPRVPFMPGYLPPPGNSGQRTLRSFTFGPFVLEPERQLLLKDGARIPIGGRALDILTALVERPGEVLSKRELLSRGWPNIFVDESNLKVTVSSLRKIFDDPPQDPRFIATMVGRGYRFIASVQLSGSHMFLLDNDLVTSRSDPPVGGRLVIQDVSSRDSRPSVR